MSGFTVAWIAWALAFCVIEGLAIRAGHGTLSAHVWYLLAHPWIGPLVVALGAWLAWHFYLEAKFAPGARGTYVDDGVLAGFFAFFSALLRRKR